MACERCFINQPVAKRLSRGFYGVMGCADLLNWRGGVLSPRGEGTEAGEQRAMLSLTSLCFPGALLPRGMPGAFLPPPEQM